MFSLKITLPTYKPNDYNNLCVSGELQVSAEVDTLSDGYAALKNQLDQLLKETQAENQIVVDLKNLQSEIELKKTTLKRVNQDLESAKAQLKRLKKFLSLLGINPFQYSLEIDDRVLQAVTLDEEVVSAEAEVDPIPFDSASDNSSHSEF
ncbi:MAG: hypothetical protein ACBR50_11490 [Microcoleus sp.]